MRNSLKIIPSFNTRQNCMSAFSSAKFHNVKTVNVHLSSSAPDDDRIVSHDAPRFMLYYHGVRDISWSLIFSTRIMNIAVLDVYGFQTSFGSAASAFENIELADIHCASKKNFSVTLKGYMCFTDLLVRSVATTNTKYETRQLKGSPGEPKPWLI